MRGAGLCPPALVTSVCAKPLFSCTELSSAPRMKQNKTKKKNTGKTHPPQLQSSQTGSSHFLVLEHKLRSGKLGPQVNDCLFWAPLSLSAAAAFVYLPLLGASLNAAQALPVPSAPQHPDNSVFKTLITIKPCYFSSSCRIS